jgi:hypothetical protein
LGTILAINTAVPCFFAIICFYVSGKHYEDFLKCQLYCKKTTLKAVGTDIHKFRDTEVVSRKGTVMYLRGKKDSTVADQSVRNRSNTFHIDNSNFHKFLDVVKEEERRGTESSVTSLDKSLKRVDRGNRGFSINE